MTSATPTSRIGRVLGSPSSSAEGAFLQERLATFGAIASPLSVIFYGVVNGLGALGSGSASWLDLPNLAILWVAAVFAVPWLVGRGRARSEGVLRALDVAVVLGACAGCAVHGWAGEASVFRRFDAMLAVANVLVVRATLLPSGGRRTAVIGVLAVVPVAVPAFVAWGLGEGGAGGSGHMSAALLTGWALVAVVVSTTVSKVIYGLHRRVRQAQKLGQYLLVSPIGRGGMGEVYLARHALLRRPTAVKLLRPELAGEAAIAAFEREVQLSSQLTHPNTVQIFDYGRTPDGVFYYAMEYLPGVDLETLVRENGALPPGRVIRVLRQVCASLAEAHDSGLVHRDVKAANVILCQRGGMPDVVKVVDFGLVREVGGADEAHERGISGTPTYLAPEVIADRGNADARADLYAVGVLGYWLLSGRLPFEGTHAAEVLAHQVFKEPPPLSERMDEPPPADLERVLMSCLLKAPAERPRGVRALDRALRRCADAGAWTDEEARAWWERHGVRMGPPAAGTATAATLAFPEAFVSESPTVAVPDAFVSESPTVAVDLGGSGSPAEDDEEPDQA